MASEAVEVVEETELNFRCMGSMALTPTNSASTQEKGKCTTILLYLLSSSFSPFIVSFVTSNNG
jgi:hypothetical protein